MKNFMRNHQKPILANQCCAHQDCAASGAYRAPKSPENLDDYHWFCLIHIREYNKNWNYYKNMNPQQMHNDQYNDLLGNRPTWQFGIESSDAGQARRNGHQPLPVKIKTALQKMQLTPPITLHELKNHYKNLVKILHPDLNGASMNNENRLKEINDAYHLLKKWLTP